MCESRAQLSRSGLLEYFSHDRLMASIRHVFRVPPGPFSLTLHTHVRRACAGTRTVPDARRDRGFFFARRILLYPLRNLKGRHGSDVPRFVRERAYTSRFTRSIICEWEGGVLRNPGQQEFSTLRSGRKRSKVVATCAVNARLYRRICTTEAPLCAGIKEQMRSSRISREEISSLSALRDV